MFKLFVKALIRVVLIILPGALLSSYIKDSLAGQSNNAAPYVIALVLMLCIVGLIHLARKPKAPEITRPLTRWESDKARKLR